MNKNIFPEFLLDDDDESLQISLNPDYDSTTLTDTSTSSTVLPTKFVLTGFLQFNPNLNLIHITIQALPLY